MEMLTLLTQHALHHFEYLFWRRVRRARVEWRGGAVFKNQLHGLCNGRTNNFSDQCKSKINPRRYASTSDAITINGNSFIDDFNIGISGQVLD